MYQLGNQLVATVSLSEQLMPVADAYIGITLQNKINPDYPLAVWQETTGPDGKITCTFNSGALAPGTYYFAATAGTKSAQSKDIYIQNEGPSITVMSPNGGETWATGSKQYISWYTSGNPGYYVKIELLQNGKPVRTISSKSLSTTGSLNWTLPSDLPDGKDYSIRVSSTSGASTDTSDSWFNITGPTIKLTSPNGGETWKAGSQQVIGWTANGDPGSYVKIELLKNDIPVKKINARAVSGKGSYKWTLPSDLAEGVDYKVMVSSLNGSCADTSDSIFRIEGPSIQLMSPKDGEIWVAGSKQVIRWSTAGKPGAYVRLELLKNGEQVRYITSRTSTSKGYFNWTVPSNLPAEGGYAVKITSIDGICTDTSDGSFSIADPAINLKTPNGGESWLRGTRQSINWDYTGNPGSYVKIELLKNGELVKIISSRTLTKNGAFKWTLPSTLVSGADYRIRITSITTSNSSDISDNNFSIQ